MVNCAGRGAAPEVARNVCPFVAFNKYSKSFHLDNAGHDDDAPLINSGVLVSSYCLINISVVSCEWRMVGTV